MLCAMDACSAQVGFELSHIAQTYITAPLIVLQQHLVIMLHCPSTHTARDACHALQPLCVKCPVNE